MKRIVWRLFWDFRKEEAWVNGMAAKGLSLTDVSWCRYAFEETPPGTWRYRIILLERMPNDPESEAYLRFLEETGIETAATYLRWAYLRQRTSEGACEVFSDTASRLAHERKVLALYAVLTYAEFTAGITNLALAVAQRLSGRPMGNLVAGLVTAGLGFGFLFGLTLPQRRKVKRLEAERRIRD